MNTNNKNGNGAKEVNTPQDNKTAIKTNDAKTTNDKGIKHVKTAIVPEPKEEEKTTPKPVEPPKTEVETPPQKPKTLQEQINYFLGLEKLVNQMRRLESHLEAVQELVVADTELNKFENESSTGASIVLKDSHHNRYEINNPRLAKEMLNHLEGLIKTKVDEFNTKILTYDEAVTAEVKS